MFKISSFRFLFAISAGFCFAQFAPLKQIGGPPVPPPRPAPVAAATVGSPVSLQITLSQPTANIGIPLVVTVTAHDNAGTTISNYAGPVTLIAVNDLTAVISASTQANGQFAFSVVFDATGTFNIRATGTGLTVSGTVEVEDHSCAWRPIRGGCYSSIPQVNAYFATSSSLTYFNQIKSIYNGASGSATVSADIATLNFLNGMQVTATTNIQAGPSNAPPPTPNTGSLAILSPTESAQAAQNMLYGGTVVTSILYPLVGYVNNQAKPGTLNVSLDFAAREGVDIQNFKAGTSILVTSPSSHTSAQIEGYLSYNAINPPDPSSGFNSSFAGSIFLGGSYGYSYTSHGYALDYGILKQNNALGQISAGILVNGVVKIAVSRAFGPSQVFMDSTRSNATTTMNNFKAWSIGIAYQSKSAASQ